MTYLSETSLPTQLGNGVQIRIFSSTHRLGTGDFFSSSLIQHLASHSTKMATKGEGSSNWTCSLVLMEPAHHPHLTHLTISSDELLLSSSTASIIVRIFSIALTVKGANSCTTEMTTVKTIQLMSHTLLI